MFTCGMLIRCDLEEIVFGSICQRDSSELLPLVIHFLIGIVSLFCYL